MKTNPNNKEHDEYAVLDDLIGRCETERTDASIRHDAIIYANKRILRDDGQEQDTNKNECWENERR